MNVVAEIQRLNERELELDVPLSGSWHQKYSESAWIFIGGLPFELSEGDVLCVLSQFGEIEDIHLVRDGKTGKSKGFAFIKYEDQRSTILAVDNLNSFKLLDRVLRVDHVLKYKLPKELQEDSDSEDEDKERKQRGLPGHAYEGKELATDFDLHKGVDKRRQEQRLKEEKEVMQREEEVPLPSVTGWRGRLEPSAARPRRDDDRREEREKREDKSFGGMRRVR
ncbi:U2 snRNP component IST3 [Phytophthora palmivora]|uniref:U2 snRNP component IST3 n=1 Tax=Phytophthora palmivora TaxID=4796 RepID=A0A2P4XM74_9STRA|nr:U2 snRNP component IST3 [Phytophthora palmivora]